MLNCRICGNGLDSDVDDVCGDCYNELRKDILGDGCGLEED